ncbi:nicotinamide phosphoribosyltransferase [Pseudoalteromonas carrageenovora]|uniref:Nicotinamide phosphoribosyltransferase n=1 Tax=Pseudoalteromonas carrageenovora IAM 12662 TaxID=1314868 RepID=A0A2K4X6J9_PSEVC|nr:nicotinate phosphoribosyltransferase [Pseudoalteromonas carrageenovora]MBE0382169.1 nicotinamide phosphoribosyltransferase [Pseudoalteromonas carrageenovora IAM 12662]QBJ70894.1 nicotinamide phosphoribosyltransferase [Pseudoalteromonas carrageenovora]GEB71282.1 nicotinate phosphoribosyltransferase [Pseudoalteromonas carrageenovora]SOU39965.1 Nicotinate phosphoribosyltransferase [Pseudoalteromonas carrageenovora IAM 12662]
MTITAASMQKDVYKEFHSRAYHPDVSEVYANFTSRSGKLSNIENNDRVAFVGLQYFIKSYLLEEWNEFFKLDKATAVANHKRIMSSMLGYTVDVKYLEDLHDLGYLPLKIKALPEGTLVPYLVPPMTIVNTKAGFQWLTNMIETVLSCENWPIQTSTTTSVAYLKVFKEFAQKTGTPMEFVPFQGHDFSFRGMFGKHAAAMSGFGHLASGLVGTDTIPAVLFAEKYYGANVDNELVGCSVDATEHSVTCSWIMEGEIEFFKYLMKEQSPKGILSVVSDTWDFWTLVTDYLPQLKSEIMARDGTLVIRPDSGDPVKVLTGYKVSPVSDYKELFETQKKAEADVINKGYEAYRFNGQYYGFEDSNTIELMECEVKGLIECLWDTFGGTITSKGYKLLDDHIGAIYGDAITLTRQRQILQRLMDKGFASKVVLGIGSYSYQYVTRDTHGSAVKATSVVKAGERLAIFKDPKTDSKKKSAKGLLKIDRVNGELTLFDDVTEQEESKGLLEVVFENGKIVKETTLNEIRTLIDTQI